MYTNNNVVFKIDFCCIVEKIVFKNLLIDKEINENKQIFEICKNQFIFNVSKFDIILI